MGGPAVAQSAMADGEVTKIDAAHGKITMRHGPIKNLDMDAMSMVFRVKDPAMLKQVKVGDKVAAGAVPWSRSGTALALGRFDVAKLPNPWAG
jgi:Cu/Ag efflux protein CusF